jgi:RNA polymerase sigma-70 factor (ECF subfamily)
MTHSVVEEDFQTRAEPYRRELLAHCYRMLGSVHDAEDLVQETYLRAWRAYDRFEERSSLRTWLYRIATNTCLNALEGRVRRPMPSGLGGPAEPGAELVVREEVPWLEPVPDTLVGADTSDPAAIVTARASIRLALITMLQHLPPRQRAALVMRDVLGWRAAEVAELLSTSTAAVNSLLQRARGQMGELGADEDVVREPPTAAQQELLDRYMAAFENHEFGALIELFTADAVWEMPPFTSWFRTPEIIVAAISQQCPAASPGDLKLVPVSANGQPAFGVYLLQEGVYRAFQLQVVSVSGPADAPAVEHVAVFFDPSLFAVFGLPGSLAAGP